MAIYLPFRPTLQGPFARRFYKRAKELSERLNLNSETTSIIREEVDWALNAYKVNPVQRRIYRATWLLLRDLLRVRWTLRWHNGTLEVAPPSKRFTSNNHDAKTEKATIRQAMAGPRLERILEAREFIERMEGPPSGRVKVPVTSLIADGTAIASDLLEVSRLKEKSRVPALRKVIQPYLQLVHEEMRCEQTGHRLSDIWRYFRLTWSTPADSTPGRTMLYLVRDKAREYHPIIGIASLENSALAISARDTFLGWTTKAFHAEISAELVGKDGDGPIRDAFGRLLKHIETAVGDINLTGLCTLKECERPSEDLLLRIAGIASRSIAEREVALREWHSRSENDEDEPPPERSEMGSSSKEAVDALYRRKRADQLGRLLAARLHLQTQLKKRDLREVWDKYVAGPTSRRGATSTLDTAIRTALQALKNRHVGTSMLELNVCGAIPPYNELLGGKLVALLMLSPEVVRDYRKRYGKRPSDIASMMKGQPVVRPAELMFLGTTSLYHVGSSQYNRLRLPAGLLRVNAPEVRWQELGSTSGFGTLHVSKLTVQCLEEAANEDGEKYVHHVFGEGPSPKLRQFRQGLDAVLGSSSATRSALAKHEMTRLVYGAWLASNGPSIFHGSRQKPIYYFDPSRDVQEAVSRITDYWRERWLLMRLSHTETISRLSEFNPEQLYVSRVLGDIETWEEFKPIRLEDSLMSKSTPDDQTDSWREFVRHLYLGTSAYADHVNPKTLEAMHVRTPLDDAVVEAVKAGKSIVITGNPGDGKTHLLRILASRLNALRNKPVVELDASTLSNSQLKSKWERTKRAGKPFCVAINEAILKGLADDYKNFEPVQEAQQQVEHAIVYGDEELTKQSVVVFDLSRRTALSPVIVQAAIEKLTNPTALSRCSVCPVEGCDLTRNQMLIRTQRFQERLQLLLDRVSLCGFHATVRELQSLISYLLFGGRSCETLLRESGDQRDAIAQLPFTGKGRLFDLLRKRFDPAQISQPVWDEALVSAETNPADWLPEWPIEQEALAHTDWARFQARKRAFYFFHEQGNQLLDMAGNDEADFEKFLGMAERDALRLIVRQLNSLFGKPGASEELRVWQSHRYNQSPRRILYSAQLCARNELQLVHPRLRASMAAGFRLQEDHVVLRLKNRAMARLRIDFDLFRLTRLADRGVPVLSLEGDTMRRVWQFMEQLYRPAADVADEVKIVLLDPSTSEQLIVAVDPQDGRYLSITR